MTSQEHAVVSSADALAADSTVAVAQALYDAFGRGDIDAVLALFDPAIEWREAEGNPYQPDGAPWVGPHAIVTQLFARLGQDWDRFTVTPRVIRAMADGVVTEGRYTGVFKATGRSIDVQICHVLRMRDGRVTHFQQYIDTSTLQWAMGYTPAR